MLKTKTLVLLGVCASAPICTHLVDARIQGQLLRTDACLALEPGHHLWGRSRRRRGGILGQHRRGRGRRGHVRSRLRGGVLQPASGGGKRVGTVWGRMRLEKPTNMVLVGPILINLFLKLLLICSQTKSAQLNKTENPSPRIKIEHSRECEIVNEIAFPGFFYLSSGSCWLWTDFSPDRLVAAGTLGPRSGRTGCCLASGCT